MYRPKGVSGWIHFLGWTGAVCAGTVFCFLLYFRYFGLPEVMNERLREELAERGLEAEFERLYLDPFGNVVARDLGLSARVDEVRHTVRVERLAFGFNWLSWWRGRPFLDRALVRNAELVLELDEVTPVVLRKVYGEVELRSGELWVRSLKGSVLNLDVSVRGVLDLRDFEAGPPPGPEAVAARVRLWREIERMAGELAGSRPLQVDVDGHLALARPEQARVRLRAAGRAQTWRGVIVEEIRMDADYADEVVRVQGEVRLLRGTLEWEGAWQTRRPECTLRFQSTWDLSLLVPVFEPEAARAARMLRFRELPRVDGRVELDWSEDFRVFVQGRAEWVDFSFGEANFDHLYLPFSTDGKRVLVPGLEVAAAAGGGELRVEGIFEDGVRGKLQSTLDPVRLKSLFGPGAEPFFDSLAFPNGGPEVECRFQATGFGFDGLEVSGRIKAVGCSYKGVEIVELESGFELKGSEIHAPDLRVVRVEGEGRADVRHDFRSRMVWLKDARVRLHPQQAARIIGDKMEEYVAPYVFRDTPMITGSGRVDVDNMKDTDLQVRVVSPAGMDHVFLGKPVWLSDLDADIHFKGALMEVRPRKAVTVFGGRAKGAIDVLLDARASYEAKVTLEDLNFGDLMRTYFENKEVKGRLNGHASLIGKFNGMDKLTGWGDMTVLNGVLYNIPIFGAFSDVLNSIIPNLGYSEASRAQATFKIDEGNIRAEKIDVFSTAFALIGSGDYHFIRDEVDLSMRVNVRGLPGVLFFPVSKLFEYRGTGTLADTRWEPKAFSD